MIIDFNKFRFRFRLMLSFHSLCHSLRHAGLRRGGTEVDLRLRRFMGITGVTKSGVEEEFDASFLKSVRVPRLSPLLMPRDSLHFVLNSVVQTELYSYLNDKYSSFV